MRRRFKILLHWKKLWENDPEGMEEIRAGATRAASQSYRGKAEKLRQAVSRWPETMSEADLKTRCLLKAEELKMLPRSMKNKLRRLSLIRFDKGRRVWVKSMLEKH